MWRNARAGNEAYLYKLHEVNRRFNQSDSARKMSMYCRWALLLLLLAASTVSGQDQSDPRGQYSRVARRGALTIMHPCRAVNSYATVLSRDASTDVYICT